MRSKTWLAIGALTLLGCKPKEGSACKYADEYCLDGHTMLSCSNDKTLVAEPCRGRAGCVAEGGAVRCDRSGNMPGDRCLHHKGDPSSFCASGARRERLWCDIVAQKIKSAPCRGPKGCVDGPEAPFCDTSLVEVGDPCDGPGLQCSGTSLMRCVNEKWTLAQQCARACQQSFASTSGPATMVVGCVPTLDAKESEPCSAEDSFACAPSGDLLACVEGKFTLKEKCPPLQPCRKAPDRDKPGRTNVGCGAF